MTFPQVAALVNIESWVQKSMLASQCAVQSVGYSTDTAAPIRAARKLVGDTREFLDIHI